MGLVEKRASQGSGGSSSVSMREYSVDRTFKCDECGKEEHNPTGWLVFSGLVALLNKGRMHSEQVISLSHEEMPEGDDDSNSEEREEKEFPHVFCGLSCFGKHLDTHIPKNVQFTEELDPDTDRDVCLEDGEVWEDEDENEVKVSSLKGDDSKFQGDNGAIYFQNGYCLTPGKKDIKPDGRVRCADEEAEDEEDYEDEEEPEESFFTLRDGHYYKNEKGEVIHVSLLKGQTDLFKGRNGAIYNKEGESQTEGESHLTEEDKG